jgi:hypothetical protein
MVQLTSSPPDVFPRDARAYFKAKSFCCREKQRNYRNSHQRFYKSLTWLFIDKHAMYFMLL